MSAHTDTHTVIEVRISGMAEQAKVKEVDGVSVPSITFYLHLYFPIVFVH